MGAVNDRVGFWADRPDPPCTDPADLAQSTTLDDAVLDLKFEALRAHVSQTASFIERLGSAVYRQWWRTESFRSADLPAYSGHHALAGRAVSA